MVVFALDPWVRPLSDRINDYLKRKLLVISCIEVYPLRKRPVGSAFLFLVRYTTFRASPLQVVVELRLHSACTFLSPAAFTAKVEDKGRKADAPSFISLAWPKASRGFTGPSIGLPH